MSSLRYVDYRYLHFFYHPLEDRFCLLNGWKDPAWANVKMMRSGLDADDRDSREQIFGGNIVDIKQKSVPELLVDEVSSFLSSCHVVSILTKRKRHFIHSIFSKLPVWFFGLWMNITTTLFVYFSYQFSALAQLSLKQNRYGICNQRLWIIIFLQSTQTMSRLKEISHFECDVRVLRNGFCKWAYPNISCSFGPVSVGLIPTDVL